MLWILVWTWTHKEPEVNKRWIKPIGNGPAKQRAADNKGAAVVTEILWMWSEVELLDEQYEWK